ncbi:SAGA histone acetyltransferase complex subunit SPT7 [Aspergillus saccharolyticus JOP 1030-1]|uniref:SAGA complex subunit Spt7 n=1 Tax=Aspergillus saccharolyticus JOP 1030-1 TaxID=1450539 RepID=A0A318ZMC3_9EURO|nr:histone acetyltransferase SAGA/ADA, catalytic subunit PCAF/GCN5 [Aspergillus saccharolyticus JOP 1030-1]PYH41338.1 histone acetyltransferase SAGA/ADA, catalytic subunit PCAF/GCN5 [Aspergillus saccharolyticus JOP 1030-1]
MSLGHHHAWLPPGHLRPPDDLHDARSANGYSRSFSGARTPQLRASADADGLHAGTLISDADLATDDDPRIAMFRDLYKRSEAQINTLFANQKSAEEAARSAVPDAEEPQTKGQRAEESAPPPAPAKKPARKLDDDDYDDYDDDDEDDDDDDEPASPPKPKSFGTSHNASGLPSPSRPSSGSISVVIEAHKEPKKETLEEIRKKLEEDKKATEEAAKRSFHTLFYTLENDRDAMLDQQRLEESERQVEAEMSGQANAGNSSNPNVNGYGSLSSANLGASSLTLKNLIARIDMKRTMVQASDAELRSLMSEVRKNRSKWASEDKIGQEELYEAAEKVLSELKAMTEHSSAFLTRVNKRDAPDYHTIIKHPMDLGTMTKKLKALQYKSKQEFVDDLYLIWSNCFKYNTNPEHFLRKHALYMKKETEKLVPLIPEIVIRDRAEVEAEERRLQLAEMDGADESDDEPIMSSRGRKAPGKSSKKGAAPVRNTPSGSEPPAAQASQPPAPVRSDSDTVMDGTQNGFATPPPGGTQTPSDPAGVGAGVQGSQGDAMEIDGLLPSSSNTLTALPASGVESEDPEYKVWKQVTKKDRAVIAAERHRLFKGDKLNPDEPALLRTKAGMRRWLRNQTQINAEGDKARESTAQGLDPGAAGETLAEGIEVDEDRVIPDYYDVMSGVPDLPPHLSWKEDSDGNIVDASEEFLRVLPSGSFTQPDSKLSRKMDANMRQMQETRKVCSKIGIVKQMQLQSQMYQNQFQKYQPEPFVEHDVPAHVMNDGGPVISPWVCKAALQRSVAKVFYHTGFEEYQPSALDAVTDIASDFFQKIGETLKSYMETPKLPATDTPEPNTAPQWKRAYTEPEMVLHTLSSVGVDVESLESYIKDDVERLGTKLSTAHDRLRSLLSELLRPALADGGEDGSNAFQDGSEQFIGGDFAEDIDEDFFGFKELGLDREFGLATLSVPLHLLQNRMYNAAQAQNTSAAQAVTLFPPPPAYPRITSETLSSQIGLVQGFLGAKLKTNNNEPLVEDLELPPKQRPTASRPRLPASGKIQPPSAPSGVTTSPQKRPLPPSASSQQPASKLGLSEPSKKKVKKNSGAGIGASDSLAEGDETILSADGAKASATTDAKPNIADERSVDASDPSGKGDMDAGPDGIGMEGTDHAVPLTNGTAAGDAS